MTTRFRFEETSEELFRRAHAVLALSQLSADDKERVRKAWAKLASEDPVGREARLVEENGKRMLALFRRAQGEKIVVERREDLLTLLQGYGIRGNTLRVEVIRVCLSAQDSE